MTLALAAMDEVTEALDLKVQICHQFHQFSEKRKKYYIAKRKQKSKQLIIIFQPVLSKANIGAPLDAEDPLTICLRMI